MGVPIGVSAMNDPSQSFRAEADCDGGSVF
jgi:hypothetical protein